ncbi:MAG: UTRA domain-containing protein [Microvirga sp.]|nr:UTRA domain-containing protein [Microvirga sp.]
MVRQRASNSYTEAYSSIEELTRFAKGTPIRAYGVDDVVTDEALATELRGRAGQSYVRITGLRFAGSEIERPIGHVVVHVDASYGDIRHDAWTLRVSIVERLIALYGVEISAIEQEVSVQRLSDDLAARLRDEPGAPALSIKRWYADADGRIFETSHSVYPMGRFAYRNVLTRRSSR